MKWVHHRGRVRQRFCSGGFIPGEPVHGHNLHPFAEGGGLGLDPVDEGLFGSAGDHI